MTFRKAKRYLNESDDFVLFTKTGKDQVSFKCITQGVESWEILLNMAVQDYHFRETLRNIIFTADEHNSNPENQA